MKGKLIGRGNTAEVYEWGEKEVLKLFYADFPIELIEREYNISRSIRELGLPIPNTSQMIEFEDRMGIVYAKVRGESMLDQIMKEPLKMKKYIILMAKLHYHMHQCNGVYDIPKYKESLEWNIRHTKLLTEKQRLFLLKQLDQLPGGQTLCHGDYHPGNVILNNDESYILDWMTASSGHSATDVARTILLLKDSWLPPQIPTLLKPIIQLQRERMAKLYWKEYQRLSGLEWEEVNQWKAVLAGARLMESVPEKECKYMLSIIKKAQKRE